MKKIVSLVLALSMVLSMFTTAFAGTALKDVEGTDYEAAVSALVELGVVNGYEDGTYQPNKVVSRAEMAKLLVVSAGLEPAADVSKGATNFSDVAADHWATGYINVAAQYGYINGYPDGTFAPDATVTYAEAVTMAIRVLGYKSVVESKGTWPTNYIAKAQELKVLEDVEYKSYSDGAVRGNVAVVVWNMLTAPMWDVNGENETSGLNYGKSGNMIDKYFDNYEYIDEDEEVVVTAIAVADGKVTITVGESGDTDTYELAEGTPFIDLFGRTVSMLYNKKSEEVVMIIPSNNDKVVEGYASDLDKYKFDGAEEFVWGTTSGDAYIKAVVSNKKVTAYTAYDTSKTGIVETVKKGKNDTTKITLDGSLTSVTLDEEAIVLIDGEWASAEDIKKGDVVTEAVANELYIVAREKVTGAFEAVTKEKDTTTDTYFVTVDGKDYSVLVGVQEVVEIDEDDEEVESAELADILKDKDSKYFDEDCTLYLNYVGEVAKIEFAEVEDGETAGKFYVVTNIPATWEVNSKSGTTTYVELNGESYEIKGTVEVPELSKSGDVVLVKFDSKDRVKNMVVVASGETLVAESGDKYTFVAVSGDEKVLDENNYISGDHKVTSNTVVVTITGVEDDEDEVIVGYEVKTSKGTTELKGVKKAIVAYETEDTFKKASYVFVWEEAKNTEKSYGIIEKYTEKNGKVYLTIDGTKYELDNEDTTNSGDVGNVATFVENDGVIKVSNLYKATDLEDAVKVTKVEDRVLALSGDVTIGDDTTDKVDLDVYEDELEDCTFLVITVSKDVDNDTYEFVDVTGATYEDIKVKRNDRISIDMGKELVIVIKGMED